MSDYETARRILVLGDIHGMKRALDQVLERAGFDPDRDLLISLGDLVDRGDESREVIEYLMALPRFRWVLGNHDEWLLWWMHGMGIRDFLTWTHPRNGGAATLASFGVEGRPSAPADIRERLEPFMATAEPFIELDDCLFAHAGFIPGIEMDEHDDLTLRWDRTTVRDLLRDQAAASPNAEPLTGYRRVFLGHTPVAEVSTTHPVRRREVWMLDQGAAFGYELTLMDVRTEEFWQSDPTRELYPEHEFPEPKAEST